LAIEESIGPGKGRTILVITPHADDVAVFCGGAIRLFADAGWRVLMVRVTNDALDSVDLDREQTIHRNAAELREAADILGIADIVDLGYETDVLGDASEVKLRERLIYLYRRERPYMAMSFDPFGVFHENNQDHIKVAQAVDEAFWTSMFDKHHPEHLAEGLRAHGLFERWYFARQLLSASSFVDIGQVIDRKIEAVAAHRTMVRNMIHQLLLQAETGGLRLPELEEMLSGEIQPFVDERIRAAAAAAGRVNGVTYAEDYRIVRMTDSYPLGGRD
jgi:LmbE family N-acetylglucosaminyl deacetylase